MMKFYFIFREYRKKCDMAKARLDSLQQKQKQYRELMIKLTGNTEKRYVLTDIVDFLISYQTDNKRLVNDIRQGST
jgi:ribosomal silencing factor RsfS